eukprot:scaffold207_cov409-Prasinococcus_capsulatus_cf.AAC.89
MAWRHSISGCVLDVGRWPMAGPTAGVHEAHSRPSHRILMTRPSACLSTSPGLEKSADRLAWQRGSLR